MENLIKKILFGLLLLGSCNFAQAQKYVKIKAECSAKLNGEMVKLFPGEIFMSSGNSKIVFGRDTLALKSTDFEILQNQQPVIDAKKKITDDVRLKLVKKISDDSIKVDVTGLNSQDSFPINLFGWSKPLSFDKETLVKKFLAKDFDPYFRIAAHEVPTIVFNRKDFYEVDSVAYYKLLSTQRLDSLTVEQSRIDNLETEKKKAKKWLYASLIGVIAAFLLGYVLQRFLLRKKIRHFEERIERRDATLDSVKLMSSENEKKLLSETSSKKELAQQLQGLNNELSSLRSREVFRVASWSKFTSPIVEAVKCLDEAVANVEAGYMQLVKGKIEDDSEVHLLRSALLKYYLAERYYHKDFERWGAAIETLKEADGVVVDPNLLRNIKSDKDNEERIIETLNKMFFREALQNKINDVFILLEEVRALPEILEKPSDSIQQLSKMMEDLIQEKRADLLRHLNLELAYAPLFQSTEIDPQIFDKKFRQKKENTPQHLKAKFDRIPALSILEITRFGIISKYTDDDQKRTNVIVKSDS